MKIIKYLIAFTSVLFLISVVKIYSQEIDSLYDLNPEQYIADEIFNKRIVMLGEGIQHHHPTTNFNLINSLNCWLEKLKIDDTLNPNLTLIFETDSTTANLIKHYIFTGEIKPLLDFVSPNYPLSQLELFYELKKLYNKISEININRKIKINFDIEGFEVIGNKNKIDEDYFKKNQRESELWFINERDVYTSKGIIRYLKANPNQKALIYYGSAHIQTGYVNKRLGGFSIPDEETMGYWLAQYLINEFGKENIDLIVSIGITPKYFDSTAFDHLKGKSFLLKKRHELFKYWLLSGVNQYYVNPFIDIPKYELNFSLSRYILEKTIDRVSMFEKLIPGYKAEAGLMPLYYLSLITGKNFKSSKALKDWYSKGEFKGFKMLDTKEFYDNIFSYYLKYVYDRNSKFTLVQLGISGIIHMYESASEKIWKDSIWNQALIDIKIINAIGIYWVGYPDEKNEAKEYLKSATGKDFNEPAEYLQWWRREYRYYGI